MECDSSRISFMDIYIIKDHEGNITSLLYCKSTAGNTLLHASSVHLQPLLRSIFYEQYLWLRRNCVSDDDYKREADALTEHLLLRGYSKTSLKKAFRRVQGRLRHELVFGCNNRPESSTVKLITRNTQKHEDLYRFIKKHWW